MGVYNLLKRRPARSTRSTTETSTATPTTAATTTRRVTRKVTVTTTRRGRVTTAVSTITSAGVPVTRDVTATAQNTVTLLSTIVPDAKGGGKDDGPSVFSIVVAIVTPTASPSNSSASAPAASSSGRSSGTLLGPTQAFSAPSSLDSAGNILVAPTGTVESAEDAPPSATASAFCALFATTSCLYSASTLPVAPPASTSAASNSTAQAVNQNPSFASSLRASPATIVATVLVALISAGLLCGAASWFLRRWYRRRKHRKAMVDDPWTPSNHHSKGFHGSEKPYLYPASSESLEALSPAPVPVLLNRNRNFYGIGPDGMLTPSMHDLSTPLTPGHHDGAYPFPHGSHADLASPRMQMASVALSPANRNGTFTPIDHVDPHDRSRPPSSVIPPAFAFASIGPHRRGSLFPITEVDSRRPSDNPSIDSPSVGVAVGTPSIGHSASPAPSHIGGVSPYFEGPFVFDRPHSHVSTTPGEEPPAAPLRLSQGAHPSLATVQMLPSGSAAHPLRREVSFSSCVSHWSPESDYQPPSRHSSLAPNDSDRNSWTDVSSESVPSVVADVIDTPVIERTLGPEFSPKHPAFGGMPPTPYIPTERDSPATPRALTVRRSRSLLAYDTVERTPEDGDATELDYDDSRFADPFADQQAVEPSTMEREADQDATPTGSPGSSRAEASSSRASDVGSDQDDTLRFRSQLRKMSLALENDDDEDLDKTVFSFPITPMPLPTPLAEGGGFPGLQRVHTGSSAYSSATGMTTSSQSHSPARPSLGRPTLSKRASSFVSSGNFSKKRPSLHERKLSSISSSGKHAHRRIGYETELERLEREKMASVRRRIRTAASQLEQSPGRSVGTSKMGLSMSSRSR